MHLRDLKPESKCDSSQSERLLLTCAVLGAAAGAPPHAGPKLVVRRKFLRRDAEDFLELTAEVSFGREIYFGRGCFAGVTLGNEFPR